MKIYLYFCEHPQSMSLSIHGCKKVLKQTLPNKKAYTYFVPTEAPPNLTCRSSYEANIMKFLCLAYIFLLIHLYMTVD